MKIPLVSIFLTGILNMLPVVASAATITVVHGINGLDLGLSRALPVDIAINGSCALTGVSFGASTRVQLPVGTFRVSVHPSTGSCSSSPVINQEVSVPTGAKYIGLVAHIADSGGPQLKAFLNDAPTGSIVVNNASRGPEFFAGSGFRDWIFYYAEPLRNGQGQIIAGFGSNRKLEVVLWRINQKRPFFRSGVSAGPTIVYYAVGSRKKGQLIISERIG